MVSQEIIAKALQATCVLSGSLFAGAALYVSLVEHPARMEAGTDVAEKEFRPSYRRAAIMQPTLSIVAGATALAATLFVADNEHVVIPMRIGSAIFFSMPLFTIFAMLPTNKQLMAKDAVRTEKETAALLGCWGRRHWVRTELSILGTSLFLYSLLQ